MREPTALCVELERGESCCPQFTPSQPHPCPRCSEKENVSCFCFKSLQGELMGSKKEVAYPHEFLREGYPGRSKSFRSSPPLHRMRNIWERWLNGRGREWLGSSPLAPRLYLASRLASAMVSVRSERL
jgi:hypothetical protein